MRNVPLETKDLLNPDEAARYLNLSKRKFYRCLKEPQPFLAYYKGRKLIIRTELERYFRQHPQERVTMTNGGRRKKA